MTSTYIDSLRELINKGIKINFAKEKMNKKGQINQDDVLELIKIGIIIVVGFIIIKALLSVIYL